MKDGLFAFVRRCRVEGIHQQTTLCLVSLLAALQENCRSPSQNHKAKDATSDSSKGQTVFPLFSPSSCGSGPPAALTVALFADAVAYAALLRNELLGAGIESVPDPHTDDRRHAAFSQDSHSLFRVGLKKMEKYFNLTKMTPGCV